MAMKTANEFYEECLDAFVKTAQGFGYANSGARGNEARQGHLREVLGAPRAVLAARSRSGLRRLRK